MEVETTFTGFSDRDEGGRRLAGELQHHRRLPNTLVLSLPGGAVVTAASVARELDLPLDVLVVRKLSAPRHEDLTIGVIGPGDVRVLNADMVALMRLDSAEIEAITRREQLELDRRQRVFRGNRPPPVLEGRTVILVDDGSALGSMMSAVVSVVREHRPARLTLAVPVAPIETLVRFRTRVDELVYLETPDPFREVADWYVDFGPVDDAEVTATLARLRERR